MPQPIHGAVCFPRLVIDFSRCVHPFPSSFLDQPAMRRFVLQAIAAVATWATGATATPHQDSTQQSQPDMLDNVQKILGEKLSSNAQIILPSSERFDNATARWSLLEQPRVNIVAVPATEDDVVEIVSWPILPGKRWSVFFFFF